MPALKDVTGQRFGRLIALRPTRRRGPGGASKVFWECRIRSDNQKGNLELWSKQHPSGQRVSDMIKFCESYLKQYAPERVLPAMPEGCVAGE